MKEGDEISMEVDLREKERKNRKLYFYINNVKQKLYFYGLPERVQFAVFFYYYNFI